MSNLSSDCESSLATESDADIDCFEIQDRTKNAAWQSDYTTEVERIIRDNVNVTTANAIALNNNNQAKLRLFRTQLETLLSQCQTRLKQVDCMVDNLRHNRKESIHRARVPGYICGQPFFKDHDLYPGPHNEDYLYRKKVKNEFFPLDMFEVSETHWTAKDKQSMKNGIWGQALTFLRREGALRAKMCGSSTKADRIRQELASLNTLSLEATWSKVQAYESNFGGQMFEVDWLIISNVNIMKRHTAAACEAMWNQYLKPGLKKSPWSPEEEAQLVTVARNMKCQDWSTVARTLANRSEYQCFVHFQSSFSQQAQIQKKPWTPEEDALLLRVVQENRIGNNVVWNKVVENMPYRNKVQVYHRYKYTLSRPIKGTKFTAEEDCVITAYVQQYGDDFKYFPEQLLPGRMMKQIWARYNNTLRYVNKHAGWSLEEDRRLMRYIADHLTEEGAEKISWSDCSRHLGNHARASCRSRYYTIEKFLDKYPNATLEDVPRRERKKLSTDVTNENWIKTIMDIKSTPKDESTSTESKSYQIFQTRGEWSLYDQMKFCFRYQFGYKLSVQSSTQQHVYTGTKTLLHLLDEFDETKPISPTRLLSDTDRSYMVAVMQTSWDWSSLAGVLRPKRNVEGTDALLCCRFPPNYNTMLGLRGVCLNAFYESAKPQGPTPNKASNRLRNGNDSSYDQAVVLFVHRFRTMFHWSMLLAMLNIDDVAFVPNEEWRTDLIEISNGVFRGANEEKTSSARIDHLIPVPIDRLVQAANGSEQTHPPATVFCDGNYKKESNIAASSSVASTEHVCDSSPKARVATKRSGGGRRSAKRNNEQMISLAEATNHPGNSLNAGPNHVPVRRKQRSRDESNSSPSVFGAMLTTPEDARGKDTKRRRVSSKHAMASSTHVLHKTGVQPHTKLSDDMRLQTVSVSTVLAAPTHRNIRDSRSSSHRLEVEQATSHLHHVPTTTVPTAQDHVKEIFIIREVDSEDNHSSLSEIIITNRCGDEQGQDNLIIEEYDTAKDDQQQQEKNRGEEAEPSACQEIFFISEVDGSDRQQRIQNNTQEHAERIETVDAESFGQLQSVNAIVKHCQQPAMPTRGGKGVKEETSITTYEDGSAQVAANLDAGACDTLPVVAGSSHYNDLLTGIDETSTAVDIIRMLCERRPPEGSETSVDFELDEAP